jgi:hypothetical protein
MPVNQTPVTNLVEISGTFQVEETLQEVLLIPMQKMILQAHKFILGIGLMIILV